MRRVGSRSPRPGLAAIVRAPCPAALEYGPPGPRAPRAGTRVSILPILATWLASDAAAPAGGGLLSFLPFVLVFVIFWLLVFRPASKEKKQREEKVRNLKKHDRVITNAGIHGTVVALDADNITLRVDDKGNVRIVFSRSAVWQVNPEGSAAPPAEDAPQAPAQGSGS